MLICSYGLLAYGRTSYGMQLYLSFHVRRLSVSVITYNTTRCLRYLCIWRTWVGCLETLTSLMIAMGRLDLVEYAEFRVVSTSIDSNQLRSRIPFIQALKWTSTLNYNRLFTYHAISNRNSHSNPGLTGIKIELALDSTGDSGFLRKNRKPIVAGVTLRLLTLAKHASMPPSRKEWANERLTGTAWRTPRAEQREKEKERKREWEKNKKGEKEKRRKERKKKERLSKQNQMQECGGPFDLGPHRLIDVAHFISLSESWHNVSLNTPALFLLLFIFGGNN